VEDDRHLWAGPLVFAVTGLLFMAIALLPAYRRRDTEHAAELI
jgi:hypothetical protein